MTLTFERKQKYYYVKVIFLSHKSSLLLTQNIYFAKYPQISENFTPLVSDSKLEPASHTVGSEARRVNYLINLNSPFPLRIPHKASTKGSAAVSCDGEHSPGCVHTPSSPWNSFCPSFLPDVIHLESAHAFGFTAEWAVCLDQGSSLLLQIRYYFSDPFQLFTTQGSDLPCPGP